MTTNSSNFAWDGKATSIKYLLRRPRIMFVGLRKIWVWAFKTGNWNVTKIGKHV